jgi:hypothetical protein
MAKDLKQVSQRTLVRMMEAFSGMEPRDCSRTLYANDFADWFIRNVERHYRFNWDRILPDLRGGRFFFTNASAFSPAGTNITNEHLHDDEARKLGDEIIRRLAALASTLAIGGDRVSNSLQLDGLAVDTQRLQLVPIETPVSAQAEEDALSGLVNRTGITDAKTILQHITDANNLFVDKKYHPSLNESRSLLQCLIDNAGGDTNDSGAHASIGFPGGTANRIEYLGKVGFLISDEVTAFKSAWGALSAGAHSGIPEREEARIGLILALEFGQILLLKFEAWKAGLFKAFARRS